MERFVGLTKIIDFLMIRVNKGWTIKRWGETEGATEVGGGERGAKEGTSRW